MRLYCDEMLQRLGRWLRAAGYDTEIATAGMTDRDIISQAARESRILLTRDRKLTEFRLAKNCVRLVHGNDIDSQVQEISHGLGIDWLMDPFSRCLLCNAPLQTALPDKWQQVPEHSRHRSDTLFVCPDCGHLYWHGGHVRRMRARLSTWQEEKRCHRNVTSKD